MVIQADEQSGNWGIVGNKKYVCSAISRCRNKLIWVTIGCPFQNVNNIYDTVYKSGAFSDDYIKLM